MKTVNVSRESHAGGKNRYHTERNVTPSLRSSDHPNAERIRPPDARTVPYWKPCRGPQLYPTATAWVRDLTEEGIEPHPGPRYLSKNVNSVQGDGKLFQMLHSIQREHTRTPITAVFVQDHRLPAARNAEMQRIARGMNMLAIATHAPPHPTTGACYGGTMIVIPHDAIELEKGETIHDATQRIERTKRVIATHKGRYVAVTMKVEQRDRNMVAAYAPATPADRPRDECRVVSVL